MYFQRKQNKYYNIEQVYNGVRYDSKKEAQYAYELDMRKKAGEIKDWERQITIPLKVYGKTICTYRIDFKVYHNDGTIEWVEVKGFPTYSWRLKWKLFEAIWSHEHPEDILTVIK